jgi:hypothetical protein
MEYHVLHNKIYSSCPRPRRCQASLSTGGATPLTNAISHRDLFPFMSLHLFFLSNSQLAHNVNLLKLTTVASVGTLSSLFFDRPSEFQLQAILVLCSSSSKGLKIYCALATPEPRRSRVAIVFASVSMASIHGPSFPFTTWRLAGTPTKR